MKLSVTLLCCALGAALPLAQAAETAAAPAKPSVKAAKPKAVKTKSKVKAKRAGKAVLAKQAVPAAKVAEATPAVKLQVEDKGVVAASPARTHAAPRVEASKVAAVEPARNPYLAEQLAHAAANPYLALPVAPAKSGAGVNPYLPQEARANPPLPAPVASAPPELAWVSRAPVPSAQPSVAPAYVPPAQANPYLVAAAPIPNPYMAGTPGPAAVPDSPTPAATPVPVPVPAANAAPVAKPAPSPLAKLDPLQDLNSLFSGLIVKIPALNGQDLLPTIKTVYPTGEKPLVVLSFKCPTEMVGVSTPPMKALHEIVNYAFDGLNRTNLLSVNLQQVCQ